MRRKFKSIIFKGKILGLGRIRFFMNSPEAVADAISSEVFDDPATVPELSVAEDNNKKTETDDYSQWALGGNGKYSPVSSTVKAMPAGYYEPFAIPGAWGLEKLKLVTDNIYNLPDMATQVILDEAEVFWNSEERYRKHCLIYKRGVILHGPAGSGKTITVALLAKALIEKDGIVVVITNIPLAIICIKALRTVEPNRKIILVFEDIDEIIRANSEAAVLSLLDGENNIDKVFSVATTNNPETLGARIINRPSRFDRRVHVGMPEERAREAYLMNTTKDGLSADKLAEWVRDTKGFSIAHLRELVAAVYCLDQPYEEVLKRLQEMTVQLREETEFKRGSMGFGAANSKDDFKDDSKNEPPNFFGEEGQEG